MKYLLDTHAFLWALRSPDEIPDRARAILADPGSDLLISIVIPWEIAIKSGVGKLKNISNLLDNFEGQVTAGGFRMVETSVRQAIQSGRLPLHHKDPFDRLLISQALDFDLPVIGCDEMFARYGVQRVWK